MTGPGRCICASITPDIRGPLHAFDCPMLFVANTEDVTEHLRHAPGYGEQ